MMSSTRPRQPLTSTSRAVVDFAGRINFLNLDAQLKQIGCPKYAGTGHNAPSSPPSILMGAAIQTIPLKVTAANPETYVTANDPPFLNQHGSADCMVPYGQSASFRARLSAAIGASKVATSSSTAAATATAPFTRSRTSL